MIKINDTYSINRYNHGWELHEKYDGKDKKGNPKVATRLSFYPSLRLICSAVIDRSAGECTELNQVIRKIDETVVELKEALGGVNTLVEA